MLRGKIYILLLITVFSVEKSFGQDIPSDLLACAAIDDEKERLACYDREMTHSLLQTQQKSADVAASSAAKVSDSATRGAAAVAVIPKTTPAQQSMDVSATAAVTSTTDSGSESRASGSPSFESPIEESASGAETSVASAGAQPETMTTAEQDFGIVTDQSSSIPGGLDELSAKVTKIRTQPHGEHVVYLDNDQAWQQDFKTSSHFPFEPGDTVTIRKRRFGGYRIYNEAGDAFRMKRIR